MTHCRRKAGFCKEDVGRKATLMPLMAAMTVMTVTLVAAMTLVAPKMTLLAPKMTLWRQPTRQRQLSKEGLSVD